VLEGEGPDSDSGEEMASPKPGKLGWDDIFNASFIHVSWRQRAAGNQAAQPRRRFRIVFVVPVGQGRTSQTPAAATIAMPTVSISHIVFTRVVGGGVGMDRYSTGIPAAQARAMPSFMPWLMPRSR